MSVCGGDYCGGCDGNGMVVIVVVVALVVVVVVEWCLWHYYGVGGVCVGGGGF